jgi:hypothetical protein
MADGGTIVGQVTTVTKTSLALLSAGAARQFDPGQVRRVRLRDPIDRPRVKAAAWLGAAAAVACASSAKCRPWKGGEDFSLSGFFGFLGFCGAGAAGGAITAAAIDAAHTPTVYMGAPGPSSRSFGVRVALRF